METITSITTNARAECGCEMGIGHFRSGAVLVVDPCADHVNVLQGPSWMYVAKHHDRIPQLKETTHA